MRICDMECFLALLSHIHGKLVATLSDILAVVGSVAGLVGPVFGYCDLVILFVGCLTSQQHASVSQGLICPDNSTCCYTEIGVADQTFYLSHSILAQGQPVPALTLQRHAPGRAATGKSILKSLV